MTRDLFEEQRTAERKLWREAANRPPAGVALLLLGNTDSGFPGCLWHPGWWDGYQWQVLKGAVPLVTHWRYHHPKEDPLSPAFSGDSVNACPFSVQGVSGR